MVARDVTLHVPCAGQAQDADNIRGWHRVGFQSVLYARRLQAAGEPKPVACFHLVRERPVNVQAVASGVHHPRAGHPCILAERQQGSERFLAAGVGLAATCVDVQPQAAHGTNVCPYPQLLLLASGCLYRVPALAESSECKPHILGLVVALAGNSHKVFDKAHRLLVHAAFAIVAFLQATVVGARDNVNAVFGKHGTEESGNGRCGHGEAL